jgi:hydrogenase nickel incorporation protein HypA/HybF
MHELSLIGSVIAMIDNLQRERDLADVRMIGLRVGALGHAEVASLRFGFDAVARGTTAEGERSRIDVVKGEGRRPACDELVPLADRFTFCPLCASPDVRMTAGGELRLAEPEIECCAPYVAAMRPALRSAQVASGLCTWPIAVIEGDQQTSRDNDRVRATGAPAVQVNTDEAVILMPTSSGTRSTISRLLRTLFCSLRTSGTPCAQRSYPDGVGPCR